MLEKAGPKSYRWIGDRYVSYDDDVYKLSFERIEKSSFVIRLNSHDGNTIYICSSNMVNKVKEKSEAQVIEIADMYKGFKKKMPKLTKKVPLCLAYTAMDALDVFPRSRVGFYKEK